MLDAKELSMLVPFRESYTELLNYNHFILDTVRKELRLPLNRNPFMVIEVARN